MKYFINDDLALSQPPEGPVASYIVPFAEWLGDRGYGLFSMRNQVLMAAGFSKWLLQKGIELSGLSEEHPGRSYAGKLVTAWALIRLRRVSV